MSVSASHTGAPRAARRSRCRGCSRLTHSHAALQQSAPWVAMAYTSSKCSHTFVSQTAHASKAQYMPLRCARGSHGVV